MLGGADEFRLWRFHADMNGDGMVNLADAWLWIKWLYLYPGDGLIYLVGNTAMGRLLGIARQPFGGDFSVAVSFFVWMFVAGCVMLMVPLGPSKRPLTFSEIVEERERSEAAERAKPWYLRKPIPLLFFLTLIVIAIAAGYLVSRK